MHCTGAFHRIAQVKALCCYSGTRERGAWRSELAGPLRIASINLNVRVRRDVRDACPDRDYQE